MDLSAGFHILPFSRLRERLFSHPENPDSRPFCAQTRNTRPKQFQLANGPSKKLSKKSSPRDTGPRVWNRVPNDRLIRNKPESSNSCRHFQEPVFQEQDLEKLSILQSC